MIAVAAICQRTPRGKGRPVNAGSRCQIMAISASVTQPKYMRWLCAWRMAPKFCAQPGKP